MTQTPPEVVLYHAECADGFASSLVAVCWCRHFGHKEPVTIPMKYGDPVPAEVDGRAVYVLDFSFKQPEMEQLCSRAREITLIDHHKTALWIDEWNDRPSNLKTLINMKESGARLTFWHFAHRSLNDGAGDFLPPGVHLVVNYVNDRDLWKWELLHSGQINAAIGSLPFDYDSWIDFAGVLANRMDSIVAEGAAILRYKQRVVDRARRQAAPATFLGHSWHVYPTVNATESVSEIGNALAAAHPSGIGVVYTVGPDGRYHYSVRAVGKAEALAVAIAYGGGGHRQAAGFTTHGPVHQIVSECECRLFQEGKRHACSVMPGFGGPEMHPVTEPNDG